MFVVLLPLSFQLKAPFTHPLPFPTPQPIDLLFHFQEFLHFSSLLAFACPHTEKSHSLLEETDEQMTEQLLANAMEERNNCQVFLGARRILSSECFHHFICEKHCRSQDRRHLWLQDWCHWWKRVSQRWIMIREAAEIRQSQGVSTYSSANEEAKRDNWITWSVWEARGILVAEGQRPSATSQNHYSKQHN